MRKCLALSANPSSAAAHARIVHLSDDTRAMVFEIITQYRAVFGDDEDDPLAPGLDRAQGGSMKSAAALVADLDAEQQSGSALSVPKSARKSYSGILCDWAQRVIGDYLNTLEPLLFDVVDGANLATSLQQSMYCGQSLSRVGCDFRPLLIPIFANAITTLFNRHLQAALERFIALLDEYRWTAGSVRSNEKSAADKAVVPAASNLRAGSDGSEEESSTGHLALTPPSELLQFLPLAVLLNGFIGALNELRLCCQETLVGVLRDQLRAVLIQGAESIRDAYEAALRASLRDENGKDGPAQTAKGVYKANTVDKDHFLGMIRAYEVHLLPHTARAFEHCVSVKHSFPYESIRESIQKLAKWHSSTPPLAKPR